jgi:dienelactone hydrolase
VIVIIPDMFGWQDTSIRLLADTLCHRTGATIYLPDFLSGDSLPATHIPLSIELPGEPTFLERAKHNVQRAQIFGPWLFRHREAVSWPIINAFFEALYTEDPARTVCVAGYGWGGRYAALLTHRDRWMLSHGGFREGGFVHAAFSAHPSLLVVPGEVAACARPVSFALGDCDELVPMKTVEGIKAALDEKKAGEYEVMVYEGGQYGFAIRGDPGKAAERELLEDATTQAVEWFKRFL